MVLAPAGCSDRSSCWVSLINANWSNRTCAQGWVAFTSLFSVVFFWAVKNNHLLSLNHTVRFLRTNNVLLPTRIIGLFIWAAIPAAHFVIFHYHQRISCFSTQIMEKYASNKTQLPHQNIWNIWSRSEMKTSCTLNMCGTQENACKLLEFHRN